MIRQWFITAIMAMVLMYTGYGYVTEVVMYDPAAEDAGEPAVKTSEPGEEKGYRSAWSETITAKDLFSRLRGSRPAPAPREPVVTRPATAITPLPKAKPLLQLSGIIKNQYGEYIAFIRFDNESPVGVRRGDRYKDIEVVSIEERKVTLMWEGEAIPLELSNKSLIKR